MLLLSTVVFGREKTFTSRKGSKFFPGHYDMQFTLEKDSLRYQLFNHWYSGCYAELRQFTIPISGLEKFNHQNDSLNFIIRNNKVYVVDKKYGLKKHIKHRKLCADAERMRKISFANQLSKENNLKPNALYLYSDLKLEEDKFYSKVRSNLVLILNELSQNPISNQ